MINSEEIETIINGYNCSDDLKHEIDSIVINMKKNTVSWNTIPNVPTDEEISNLILSNNLDISVIETGFEDFC